MTRIDIEKINLYPVGREPSGRPRTGEAILARRSDGMAKRFEFDYDNDFVYVYTALFRNGRAVNASFPVRRIPRVK